MISDIWWPRIHREVIDHAKLCGKYLESNKNKKCVLSQKQFQKIAETSQQKEEALHFAVPFQKRKKGRSVY